MTPLLRAVVACSLACATVLTAQQPPAPGDPDQDFPDVTFRVEVNYVEVDAFVTDALGNPVLDLTAADFELLEDGEPQAVASFVMVDIPIERAERPLFAERPVEPDVRTNEGAEGRIYLFLLDDMHVHPSRAPRVRAALRQFLERNFGTNDLAAVVSARGSSADSQDFTNNPRLLLRAIDRFTGSIPLDSTPVLTLGDGQAAPLNPAQSDEAHRARTVMRSLETLAEFLGNIRGRRKTLIFVSEGIAYDIFDAMNPLAPRVVEDTERASATATRNNVSIYAIDPRGLMDAENLSGDAPSDSGGFRRSQESLRVLAADTGGFAAVNQSDFTNAFDRIVRENSAYYILGYYPTNERRDGRYRRVQVRVTRPGLQVRSRSGYTAPRGAAPRGAAPGGPDAPGSASMNALSSPLPVRGVPMRMFAAAYKGPQRNASIVIAIEFNPSTLSFLEADGTFNEEVDVVHAATEPRGRTHPPVRHRLKLALKPDTFERVKQQGLRVLSQMDLPPGRYQLRAAVGNDDAAGGSVLYDLDVPDFTRARLEMSGLALTSLAAAQVTTVRPLDPLRDFLPGPAIATREFESGDTLALYGEVYENVRNAPEHTVDITGQLRRDDGLVLRTMTEQRSSTEVQGVGGGYGFMFEIGLDDLEPGLYVIHVQARSNIGDRPTVTRDVQIRVH